MIVEIQSAITLLSVFDVPASIAFYRDVIGFEVANTSEPFTSAKDDVGWAMLRFGSSQLMVNNSYQNNIRPAERDPVRVARHADTILYLNCEDADVAYAALQKAGVEAEAPFTTYFGARQVYLKDPDGHGVCFHSEIQT